MIKQCLQFANRIIFVLCIIVIVALAAGIGVPACAGFAPTYVAQWGLPGTGNGQFKWPCGIAIDTNGNVYVADTNNNRIQEFTSTGTYVTQWGNGGTGNGQFASPLL